MLKYLFAPTLAALLVFGNDEVRVFASAIVWALLVLIALVAFTGKTEPDDRSRLQRYWGRACTVALTAALIYAGYPILAALWLAGWGLTYAARAVAKAKENAANEKH